MINSAITLIVAIVGILGTLGGVFLGHLLTRSWQREQWLRDCRKDELRVLLDALSDYFTNLLDLHREGYPQGPAEQEKLADLKAKFFRTVHSRLFIAGDVERLDIEVKWMEAVNKYRADFDILPLVASFDAINRSLVKAALEHRKG